RQEGRARGVPRRSHDRPDHGRPRTLRDLSGTELRFGGGRGNHGRLWGVLRGSGCGLGTQAGGRVMTVPTTHVAIIGARPGGSVAAALLLQRGWRVEIMERQHFPRFSIGESLLPQCMEFLTDAGLLDDIAAEGFQFKDGAAFDNGLKETAIYFPDKSSPGP